MQTFLLLLAFVVGAVAYRSVPRARRKPRGWGITQRKPVQLRSRRRFRR